MFRKRYINDGNKWIVTGYQSKEKRTFIRT